jgi:GlpG protein
MIGQIAGTARARALGDYLLAQGIDNVIEADKGDTWTIWVNEEEHLDRARVILEEFEKNPADPKYSSAGRLAEQVREAKRKEQEAYEKRVKARRNLFVNLKPYQFGALTFALIIISAAVYVYRSIQGEFSMGPLYINQFADADGHFYEAVWPGILHAPFSWNALLVEVRHGEFWRLVTPIFIHMSIMHIFFNMWWMADLGSMIEARQSTFTLAVLVLAIAVISNLAQYFIAGPAFGGMSGVVYGLLGYIWIRGKRDPASGLYLHKSTVTMSMIWFFFCFVSSQPVANWCHTGGLLSGMAWGYLSSLGKK